MAWPHPSRIGGGIMMSWISIATSAGMSDAWVGQRHHRMRAGIMSEVVGVTSRLAVDYLIALPGLVRRSGWLVAYYPPLGKTPGEDGWFPRSARHPLFVA